MSPLPKDFTPEEEFMMKKFQALAEKKKLLAKLKQRLQLVQEAKKKSKRSLDNPEEATQLAKKLASSGAISTIKSSRNRTSGFKRSLSKPFEAPASPDISYSKSEFNLTEAARGSSPVKKIEESVTPTLSPSKVARPARMGNTCYVVCPGFTEAQIQKLFLSFGDALDIRYNADRQHAFVSFKSIKAAEKAVNELDGHTSKNGAKLSVGYAKQQNKLDEADDINHWTKIAMGYTEKRSSKPDNKQVKTYGNELF